MTQRPKGGAFWPQARGVTTTKTKRTRTIVGGCGDNRSGAVELGHGKEDVAAQVGFIVIIPSATMPSFLRLGPLP